jgi:hypothetical protein
LFNTSSALTGGFSPLPSIWINGVAQSVPAGFSSSTAGVNLASGLQIWSVQALSAGGAQPLALFNTQVLNTRGWQNPISEMIGWPVEISSSDRALVEVNEGQFFSISGVTQ